MNKVAECVERVSKYFDAVEKGDQAEIEKLANEVSELEHAADLAKNDIRNNLPKSLFLPVEKRDVLRILALQDSIADRAEDVGALLAMQKLSMPDLIKEDFEAFLAKNLEAFEVARRIIQQMDELLESSFGGVEAAKVTKMVEEVAFKEHEADLIQRTLLQKLLRIDSELSLSSFYLWLRVLEMVGDISDLSENLGNQVRMMLDVR